MERRKLIVGAAAVFLLFSGPWSLVSCDNRPSQGQLIYTKNCSNCHGDDGEGLGALIPPLAGADYVAQNQASLPCIIHYGIDRSIMVNGTEYEQPMAGIPSLSLIQMTNLINFINSSWGNELPRVTVADVTAHFEECPEEMPIHLSDTVSSN